MSSKKVTFIVGLYGSGKTHFLKSHAVEYEGALILDDPSVTHDKAILDIAITHDKVVIADPILCLLTKREIAERIFKGFEQYAFRFIPSCNALNSSEYQGMM